MFAASDNKSSKTWVNVSSKAVVCQQLESPIVVDTNTTYTQHPQMEEVRVDMAGMKIDSRPVELVTSVGSCVGICLYDRIHRCGGLAHIMLPHSHLGLHEPLPSKFADTAVVALTNGIRALTGQETRLTGKIAGGANMFANTLAKGLDIGGRNIEAVRQALTSSRIRITGEDVGGSNGRRISFNLVTGEVTVKIHSGEKKKI